MTAKIVVVGSFNADLVTYLTRLPAAGETISGRRFVTGPGGKGSNQAVAAARAGAQVSFVGCVGQDTLAEIGLQLWQQEQIDTRHVGRIADEATGVAVIFVDDAGQNVIAITAGANGRLDAAHLDSAEAAIAGADFLMTQLESPLASVAHALRLARRHGVPTMLNPAPAQPLPADLLALVDYLTPNEHELTITLGQDTVAAAAAAFLQQPRQTLVITLGDQGARWLTQQGQGHVPAFPVQAVDTVGAGDAFNGGLAVALAEGQPLEAALRFACAVGALSVTRYGAASSMPRREEVEQLLARGTL
ncbi:MAG: ribokinase [Anaerolineae bacterium]|jgi:ribokinase|nr:ribokinase [Anaerolineae bacterium]